jgi:Prealbumin-like fold domain
VRFRTLIIFFGFIVMAVFTSAGQTPAGGESGIEGIITISPSMPGPTRMDAPGSVPLANVTFVVENKNGEVTSFTTDDKGHFLTALPPGHYKVSLKGRKSSIGRFGPFEADVAPGKTTNVQWECDSGIR